MCSAWGRRICAEKNQCAASIFFYVEARLYRQSKIQSMERTGYVKRHRLSPLSAPVIVIRTVAAALLLCLTTAFAQAQSPDAE